MEGLQFDFDKQHVMPNTRKAHVLIAGAKEVNKQAVVSEALFDSYFSGGIDLSNDENLITVGVNAGLERSQIEGWLSDESRFEEIQSREQELSGLGIQAVPFFILNEKFGLSGAQPTETFINVIKEVGNKSLVEAPSCGPDGYC
jgi:predicted DsbA family dithiol-disulfide isomerase